jgi:hypothetical protein
VANSKQTKQTKSGDSKFSVSSSGQSRQGKSLTVALPSLPSQIQNVDWQRVKHPNRWGARVLAILFIIVSLLGGYVGAWLENHNNNGSVTFADLSNQEKVVTSQSQLIDQIAKSVGPSVVSQC